MGTLIWLIAGLIWASSPVEHKETISEEDSLTNRIRNRLIENELYEKDE